MTYASIKFGPKTFDVSEAKNFIMGESGATCDIFTRNAEPMLEAWSAYKRDDIEEAVKLARHIVDEDWRMACLLWLRRRIK